MVCPDLLLLQKRLASKKTVRSPYGGGGDLCFHSPEARPVGASSLAAFLNFCKLAPTNDQACRTRNSPKQ